MDKIKNIVDNNIICIFTKPSCVYCKNAITLLDSYNFSYSQYSIDKNNDFLFNALKKYTNCMTVPNIFIYGKHIGGFTELNEMHEKGALINITINNYKTCLYCGGLYKNKCNCFPTQTGDWGEPL
jgi:glutaredoxin 3